VDSLQWTKTAGANFYSWHQEHFECEGSTLSSFLLKGKQAQFIAFNWVYLCL